MGKKGQKKEEGKEREEDTMKKVEMVYLVLVQRTNILLSSVQRGKLVVV